MVPDVNGNIVKAADLSHWSLLWVVRVNKLVHLLCPALNSFSLQAVSNSRPFKNSPAHVLNSRTWGNKSSLLTFRVIEGQNCRLKWRFYHWCSIFSGVSHLHFWAMELKKWWLLCCLKNRGILLMWSRAWSQMISGRLSGFWCRIVDVAFSRVFSVRIPLPDQIVPEIWLSTLVVILVVRLKSSSCFSQQYPPILCADLGIRRQGCKERSGTESLH